MTDDHAVEEISLQLVQMEEERFVTRYHQNVEKQRQKVWHDRHIKNKQFQVQGLILMYDNKFLKHPGKLKKHWLGSYIVTYITNGGAVQLQNIDGTPFRGLINGIQLKSCHDSRDLGA